MEAVSISVELDKGLLHSKHSMELLKKGNHVINAT
jgi:hypothetical protein